MTPGRHMINFVHFIERLYQPYGRKDHRFYVIAWHRLLFNLICRNLFYRLKFQICLYSNDKAYWVYKNTTRVLVIMILWSYVLVDLIGRKCSFTGLCQRGRNSMNLIKGPSMTSCMVLGKSFKLKKFPGIFKKLV